MKEQGSLAHVVTYWHGLLNLDLIREPLPEDDEEDALTKYADKYHKRVQAKYSVSENLTLFLHLSYLL